MRVENDRNFSGRFSKDVQTDCATDVAVYTCILTYRCCLNILKLKDTNQLKFNVN